MKNALITGTSSGIGYALAGVLLERGWRVLGSVHCIEEAEYLRQTFGERFEPLLFDVTELEGIQLAAQRAAVLVGNQGLQVLINNAGIAVTGPLLHVPTAALRQQFAINVMGVVAVTQSFAPLLGARTACPHPPGRLVNMGSIAATLSAPFGAPYGASKRSLEALTDSLRLELMPFGIKVLLLEPGVVATNTQEGLKPADYAHTLYHSSIQKAQTFITRQVRQGWQPSIVAQRVADAIEAPTLAWQQTFVKGRWLNWSIPRRLPQRLVAWATGRFLGLSPKGNSLNK